MISPDIFAALILFATVATITPGPNNLMVMASGANFGLVRTVPHIFGIAGGFAAMILLVSLGLGRIFAVWPLIETILTIATAIFLLYLAWKIATAAAPRRATVTGRPLTILQAAAFQWVNPKAWAMALSATSIYVPDRDTSSAVIVAVTFFAVCFPCVTLWTLTGQELRRFLTTQRRLRAFNWTMATFLLASMVPALL